MVTTEFTILLEDKEKTFNVNEHVFSCFAVSVAEAIGKMVLNKPKFITYKILTITSYNFVTKKDKLELIHKDYEDSMKKSLEIVNQYISFEPYLN